MDTGKLPIGIRTFREIREGGYRYVDKTAHAGQIANEGKHLLLSRPRGFGKSLLVDTLKELFEGNERLFRGLDIHPDWDWSVRHPVVRLDLSDGDLSSPDLLDRHVVRSVAAVERGLGLEPGRGDSGHWRLGDLIRSLHERSGQRVVLLVDECHRPIADTMDTPEAAEANRGYLNGLYAITKSYDDHLKFSLFTGAATFILADMVSGGANNLLDISLDPQCSSACGFTDAELDRVFARELAGLDRDEVRDWYGGYSWRGDERVHSPGSVLRLLDERKFGLWWHESGMPEPLLDELARHDIGSMDLEGRVVGYRALSALEIGRIPLEGLLFQAGALTVKGREEAPQGMMTGYRLGYPNREVREALGKLGHSGAIRPRAG